MADEFTLDDAPASSSESADILNAMPEPQQHAIDATAESVGVGSQSFAEVDEEGNSWDPSIHATGVDGKGVKTAKGLWRKKRGAAKQASVVGGAGRIQNSADTQNSGIVSTAPTSDALIAQARAAGAAAAGSIFMFGRALGGEDWAPTADEVTVQTEAWSNYFIAKGIYDFPPGLALCIAVTGYAAPRFFTPKTQERVGTIKHWFAIRVAKHRVKRALKRLGVDAVVTIKGSKSADVYDSILVNGQPFNALGLKPDGTRVNPRHDVER